MNFTTRLLNANHVKAYQLPDWELAATPADQLRAVRLADELGYWKVNIGEHFVVAENHRDLSGDHYPHAVTALAVLAGATSRIKLGSHVTILPLVNPIAQAKMWATLDWLSGGRALVLAGVGWQSEEYDMLGVPFHERGKLMDEYVAAMLELWSSDNPTFEGKYVSFKDVGASPKPVNRAIPLWFGGDAPGVLRRVAKWGSGWSPRRISGPEEIPEFLDRIRGLPEYHGQDLGVAYSMSMLRLGAGHVIQDDPRAQPLNNAQAIVDQIGWLASFGVTETLVARPPQRDLEEHLDWLRWVAEEVMPKVG